LSRPYSSAVLFVCPPHYAQNGIKLIARNFFLV